MGKHGLSVQERVENRLDKSSECWIWQGCTTVDGYGTLNIKGKTKRAHRVYWEELNGSIPEGMCVCHTCDTPSCVKLEHLFLGTQVDNIKDMDNKRRRGIRPRPKCCPQGHSLNKVNTYYYPTGYYSCRVCNRDRASKSY